MKLVFDMSFFQHKAIIIINKSMCKCVLNNILNEFNDLNGVRW